MHSEAIRLPLSDGGESHTPYLYSTSITSENGDPIIWNQQNWLNMIHLAEVIEVSSRGVRVVWKSYNLWTPARKRLTPLSQDTCKAKEDAFCWMGEEGGLFPSETRSGSQPPDIHVTGLIAPVFLSGTLAMYEKKSEDSCGDRVGMGWGNGRIIIPNSSVYTVTSCDILNGHFVLMYEPGSEQVYLFSQTFGPMAYSVIIISSLLCLYGASGEVFRKFPNNKPSVVLTSLFSMATTISCCLLVLVHGIPFVTIGDESNFWVAVFLGLAYACFGIWNQDATSAENSCIFALITVTVAMYRSPENPYAGILISIISVKQWQKALVLSSPKALWKQLDLLVTTLHLCLLIQVGLVPQFAEAEDWPVYAAVGMYTSFCVAWYQSSAS